MKSIKVRKMKLHRVDIMISQFMLYGFFRYKIAGELRNIILLFGKLAENRNIIK